MDQSAHRGETLELGRSCVEKQTHDEWQSIQHIFRYDIVVMFGCASMPGTDPQALARPLSYLYHYHLEAAGLAAALDERYVDMRLLPQEQIDQRRTLLLNCRP